MIPEFGKILSADLEGANTPELARIGVAHALTKFWRMIISNHSLAKFFFSGTAIVGPSAIPVIGTVGSFSTNCVLYIPNDIEIKNALATTPNVWKGFFKLFEHTIHRSAWFIDCKAASYSTPFAAKLRCTTVNSYAEIFLEKMNGLQPNTHEDAMNVLTDGVKEFLQTVINEVPYTGTGAGQLTGTMTVTFSPHI